MNQSPLVSALSCAILVVSAGAQQLVRTINGPAANAQYGKACIAVTDQNGDGFKDVLVGAPGFNQQRGAIYCLSGAYLASGAGTQTLWSIAPAASPGDLFGFAIADMGDMTGDGASDYLVGQPGYDNGTTQDAGAVRLISGGTGAILSLCHGPFQGGMAGSALAAIGDASGDGISEAVIGAPGPNSVSSNAYILSSGAILLASGAILSGTAIAISGPGADEIGASVVGGIDLNGDGFGEFAIGAPGRDSSVGADVGRVMLLSPSAPGLFSFSSYSPGFAGERFGAALDAAHDYDGDGVADFIVGAPNHLDASFGEAGRVVLLSGASLLAQIPPYEIRTLPLGFGTNGFDYHFGAAVRASSDLNGDGVGEILVGAPDYFTFGGGGTFQNKGLVSVVSGATGTRWNLIAGGSTDRLGDALAGAVDDLDGDGFKEFVFAGSRSDVGGTDSGVVRCYRFFPVAPATYCTGKVNSLGCTPAIAFSGTPSANPAAPFLITASNFINHKSGLLFYSHAPTAVVFQGGTKCVANLSVRTPPSSSGGSASGNDCSGAHSFDFNDWVVNGWDSSLGVGAEIYAQYWSRDPQSPSHTSLSNAVRFLLNP